MNFTGLLYRADQSSHTDLGETAAKSRKTPGRFNTSRLGAVYLSVEPDTAFRELQRNDDGHSSPLGLFVVQTSLACMLDLTNQDTMVRWELARADLVGDDLSRCQRVAEDAANAGIEAIYWPSATGNGHNIAVFFDRLGSNSRLAIEQVYDLSSAALNALDAGVPVASMFPLLPRGQ